MLMENPGGNLIEFTGMSRRLAVPIASNPVEIQRIRSGRIRRLCLAMIVNGCISQAIGQVRVDYLRTTGLPQTSKAETAIQPPTGGAGCFSTGRPSMWAP